MRRTTISTHILFAIVCLVAIGSGFAGLDFGNHWDEGPIFRGVQRAISNERVLPDWYNYPSTTHNLVMLCAAPDLAKLKTGQPQDESAHGAFYGTKMRARGAFLLLTSLATLWVYLAVLLWRRQPWEALLAAALLAGSWEAAYHARWIAPDGVTMQFTALFVLAIVLVLRDPDKGARWLYAAAVVAGLACGTKYTGGVWLAVVLIYALIAADGARRPVRQALIVLVLFAGTVVATTPGILLDTQEFIKDIRFEIRHYATQHDGYTVPRGPGHAALMLQYLGLAAFSRFIPLSLAVLGLCVLGAANLFKSDRRYVWLMIVVPVGYFVFLSLQSVMIVRNLLMLFPFIAILAARGGSVLLAHLNARLSRRLVVGLLAAAVAVNLSWLVYAAGTIAAGDHGLFRDEVVEYLRGQEGETVFLSESVRRVAGDVSELPIAVTRRRDDATRLVLAMCDAFERRAWPANHYGRWQQLGGQRDVNLDYYPTWGGDCRVLAIDAETARAIGPIRGQ